MISDFQLVLIGIIALVIVGVIVYNRWQELKYKKRAEQAFASDSGDALFADKTERVEPSMGALTNVAADDNLDDLDIVVPGTQAAAPVTPAGRTGDLTPAINTEIDTVALILADAPVVADVYAPIIKESQQLGGKILWEGLVGGIWMPIDVTADEQYRELRAGLQLADRGGATELPQIQSFDDAMIAFAARIDAVSQREDATDAARRAQMVDQFCADTDVEIAINVAGKSGVTFAATKIRGLAESQGLTALASGEFVMKDDLNRVIFLLRNGVPTEPTGIRRDSGYHSQLTFALDVPRTPNATENFERMFTMALQFADVLHGEVVDDNKKLLTANGRKMIHDTIREIVGEMQQKGVASGSSTALRLYA